MSTPLNKKRLLPLNAKEQVGKSPRTPKTLKKVSESMAPVNPSSSTSLLKEKKKDKNKELRNSSIPSRFSKGTTPVKVNTRLETPARNKLNTKIKETEQAQDSFSTIVLEQKQSVAENSHTPKSRMNLQPFETGNNNSSIKVAVRVRPFSEREVKSSEDTLSSIITMNGNVTVLKNDSGRDHKFTYDNSFWSIDADNSLAPYATQEDVYRTIAKPLLHYSFEGYNTCLFAYGQTGSGKSYTVMGYESENETGIIPRFSKDLFKEIENLGNQHNAQYSVEISYYEIYNEKIFDLLSVDEARNQRLFVRESPDFGPYVQGLSTQNVGTHKDIQNWLEVGNKNRATASTGMNEKSSRSHSVFIIILTQVSTEQFEGTETELQKTSRINLIDLAGSERAKKVIDDNLMKDNQAMDARLKEGGCINKSLHTLGKVISILSEMELKSKKKIQYIPYRDSVLTWLLKESLGGNAKTTMIATISPSALHYHETLSTLRYAQQARAIVNNAKVNEDPKSKLIREMFAEIQRLKDSQERTGGTGNALEKEVETLRYKLHETQDTLASSTRSWQEKLASSEKKQRAAASHLRRSGVAFTKLEDTLPSLVNLNEDPQLAEVLVYILNEGVTNVGQKEPLDDNDIQLRSDLIADQHCIFTYSQGTIIISPVGEAPTYVNGVLLFGQFTLHHGDRIVIGGDHFFRLNHPKESGKMKEANQLDKKGFEFAKSEFIENQNKRLEEELEVARIKANEDAMEQIRQAQLKARDELDNQRRLYEQQMEVLKSKLADTTDKQKLVEEEQHEAKQTISKLKANQKALQDEMVCNREKLQMEVLTARQMLEETTSKQSQLIDALEHEKRKMENDLNNFKKTKAHRDKMRSSIHIKLNNLCQPPNGGCGVQDGEENDAVENDAVEGLRLNTSDHGYLLKIALLTREANLICQRVNQPYIFSRDDLCTDSKVEISVRISNTVTRKSTLIPVDRFAEELSRMRDRTQNGNLKVPNEEEFTWRVMDTGSHHQHRKTRVSLSNDVSCIGNPLQQQQQSFVENFNRSFDQQQQLKRSRYSMDNSRLVDMDSSSRLGVGGGGDASHLLLTPSESTRLSSVHQNSSVCQQTCQSDLSITRSTFFETILEIETDAQTSTSIIASLINLIISIYKDWNRFLINNNKFSDTTTLLGLGGGGGSGDEENALELDTPVVRIACNLKCLRDQATILCAVHEAVGLEDLKKISQAFRLDIAETCAFVKKYVLKREESTESCKKQFKHLIFQLIELTGALSLSAVDHIGNADDENTSYIENNGDSEIFVHFLKQQNRFLSSMMDEALSTVLRGVEDIKLLQLSQTHEMSEDLVDGVMNILTSTTTLIRRCKDLVMVYGDINVSESTVYYAKECVILRQFLTSVVDYNESVINMVWQSKQVATNCDSLEDFTDIPVELADTTKCICKAGRDLYNFLSSKKKLDFETLSLLRSCIEKFEFAGKTVRVGVAIVIQEIEQDLGIQEDHSVMSLVQSELSFQRNRSMCPLNRTSLDLSAIQHPQVQDKFKGRRSGVRPDLFISRYMDDTASTTTTCGETLNQV